MADFRALAATIVRSLVPITCYRHEAANDGSGQRTKVCHSERSLHRSAVTNLFGQLFKQIGRNHDADQAPDKVCTTSKGASGTPMPSAVGTALYSNTGCHVAPIERYPACSPPY